MMDSEDYHTGRAAAYHTAVGLLRRVRCDPAVVHELERLQLAAEAAANVRAGAAPCPTCERDAPRNGLQSHPQLG